MKISSSTHPLPSIIPIICDNILLPLITIIMMMMMMMIMMMMMPYRELFVTTQKSHLFIAYGSVIGLLV